MAIFEFSKWRPPLSWILKIFNARTRQEGGTASLFQIATESL